MNSSIPFCISSSDLNPASNAFKRPYFSSRLYSSYYKQVIAEIRSRLKPAIESDKAERLQNKLSAAQEEWKRRNEDIILRYESVSLKLRNAINVNKNRYSDPEQQ